jgi:hypothetical protein
MALLLLEHLIEVILTTIAKMIMKSSVESMKRLNQKTHPMQAVHFLAEKALSSMYVQNMSLYIAPWHLPLTFMGFCVRNLHLWQDPNSREVLVLQMTWAGKQCPSCCGVADRNQYICICNSCSIPSGFQTPVVVLINIFWLLLT